MTFFGMIAGQIGTAFAARTDRASLRSVGVFSNRLLLWGIAFELVLAAVLIYVPLFQSLLATAALSPVELLFALPFPFIVWGADELRRYLIRRRSASVAPSPGLRSPRGSSLNVTTPAASGRAPATSANRKTRCPGDTEKIAAALARSETYAHRPTGVELRETHISWVFLADEHAYKLKQWRVRGFMPNGNPGSPSNGSVGAGWNDHERAASMVQERAGNATEQSLAQRTVAARSHNRKPTSSPAAGPRCGRRAGTEPRRRCPPGSLPLERDEARAECGCFGRLKRLRRTMAAPGHALLSLSDGHLGAGPSVSDLRGYEGPCLSRVGHRWCCLWRGRPPWLSMGRARLWVTWTELGR